MSVESAPASGAGWLRRIRPHQTVPLFKRPRSPLQCVIVPVGVGAGPWFTEIRRSLELDSRPQSRTLRCVTSGPYTVRRALVDDRPALVALWESMRLPTGELEKRLTEFQVAVDANDQVIGAIGIRLAGKQGLIHSEAYVDFALADTLRTALWDRLQSLATNHGLVRLWTNETAPFWTRSGLTHPDARELEKLPADWKHEGTNWLTLKLREDLDEVIHLDHEFALFMQAEKERSRQMLDQGKMLKLLATLLAVALFLSVIGMGLWMVMKHPNLLGR